MSDETKTKIAEMTNSVLHWRLAIWKSVNGAVIVALGAIVAGLSNLRWDEMDGQARFLFVAGVALTVLKSLDMLFDQTIANLKNENIKSQD